MVMLPVVRSSERKTYKRCQKKWFWEWRRGLVPKAASFGALELGTWYHTGQQRWYGKGLTRHGSFAEHVNITALASIELARRQRAPEHILEEADRLAVLGVAMAEAYETHYGMDEELFVLGTEVPLEFTFPNDHGKPLAIHKLKPDLIFRDPDGGVWIKETKTAASIRTGHLVIDDQARPYGAMGELALMKAGILSPTKRLKGVMYCFSRKALPDEREMNSEGKYLNKDGSVSKRQPPPLFERKPITMTHAQKRITLQRVRNETCEVTLTALELRTKQLHPNLLNKTPDYTCPKTCQFFDICVAEENGGDIRDMERLMFTRRDPYTYEDEHPTTDDPAGFEMG